ncbi:hypothetical protein [Arcobacter sp.]|uniref:hypothetical protein n=1 Tax=unclassified Arcobacter TaxID=2593671 RepID=UPI003B00A078|eukprot:TRINITY_DN3738_c0_g5_i2.p2 TRINITY_DN3738_c0_g5~~TRINITY_DN3738_c0_g5_i2.p2  ORF type:complete len:220 (+),score=-61.54 TRINITY_DN3738_c0_g5_i2:6-665(+)
MKKYTYHISIASLVCMLFASMYLLYSNSNSYQEEITQEKLLPNKTVNIKKDIDSRKNKLLGYKIKEVNSKDLDIKMSNLKTMLEKTQVMLKEYNDTHPQKIINNQEIDKLVNLDLNENNSNIKNKNNVPIKDDLSEKKKEDENLSTKNKYNYVSNNYVVSSPSQKNVFQATSSSKNKVKNSSSSNANIIDSNVSAEVSKLQMQIEDVKKVITQVSSNIN